MECTEVFSRLSAWLDGELESAETGRVEEHVARCRRCRREQTLLAATSRAVRSLPPETVSDGFDARLRLRLTEDALVRRRRLRHRISVSALAAAAVLTLAFLGVLRRRDSPRTREAGLPLAWAARVPEPAGYDCRASPTGRCRIDAPCASARSCGIFPTRSLLPAPPIAGLPTVDR